MAATTIHSGAVTFVNDIYRAMELDLSFDSQHMGARFRFARRAKKLTQQQVAAYLAVEKGTVSHWETGRHDPPFEALVKLTMLYGRSLSWFLIGQEIGEEIMTREGYELARACSVLPPALQRFVTLTASMADKAKEQFPDRVIADPTEETWLEFAKALHAAINR